MKTDLCQNKACENYLRFARYCGHYTPTVKPKPEIKKQSKKLGVALRNQYAPVRKEYLAAHPVCEVKDCLNRAVEIHHRKGRIGELLIDQRFFLAVCSEHHRIIESSPVWARIEGYSLSRHSKA